MSFLGTLPRGVRHVVGTVLAFLIIFGLTQFVFPGRGGDGGTPLAILYIGLVIGSLNALAASGIVLIYRTTRVINFAQTAMGAAGAVLLLELVRFTEVPFLVAFVLALLVTGLVGLTFDLIFGRRFFNAPRLVLTVITIAAAGLLAGTASGAIQRLPIFPAGDDIRRNAPFSVEELRQTLPFEDLKYTLGSLEVPYGFAEIFAILTSLAFLLALGVFFRYSRFGVAVRAMSENVERTSLLGISTGQLSSVVWTIAGFLAGAGIVLTTLISGPEAAQNFAPAVLLPALAAAVLGGMRSIGLTVAAAIGISILNQATNWSFRDDLPLIELALFVVVGAGLLLQRRRMLRTEESLGGSWKATEEIRPIPAQLASISSIRITRWVVVAILVIGTILYPFLVSTGATNLGGVIALSTIVAISLVVLTGWAGQVSLGQYGLVALGTVVAGSITGTLGWSFWAAVPLATLLTAGFAMIVGLPALRIKGLYLGVTTFAFAIAAHSILFSERYMGWMLPDSISRPRLFLIDFESERNMYFLCIAALVLVITVVVNLRKSRFGRLLIALRENEANVQSLGVSVVRMKLLAFALSGALAGFAGAIFAHQQRGLSAESFEAQASINIFLVAVVGGVTSVAGALLGSAYFNFTTYLVNSPVLATLLGPGATLYILYAAPGGFISILAAARDSVLRIVAQRRQLIVPSLFADYDPDVLQRRLVPLGAPTPGAGLNAFDSDLRFDKDTHLYPRSAVALNGPAGEEEGAVIGAAATGLEGRGFQKDTT